MREKCVVARIQRELAERARYLHLCGRRADRGAIESRLVYIEYGIQEVFGRFNINCVRRSNASKPFICM